MTRWEHAPEIRNLAGQLGVGGGAPVDRILDHCHRRIDGWVAEVGGTSSIDALEALVTSRLQMVFEEIRAEEDFDRLTQVYAREKREFVFATMRSKFDEADNPTFGALVLRRNASTDSPDRFIAVIDCRGSKLARRFFTRWHEIAHRMTTHADGGATEPGYRSEHDPIERMMDEIAGHVGFYGPLFSPVLRRHHDSGRLTFAIVETIRKDYCADASFQATLFAAQRRLPTPLVYLEAQLGYKVGEERRLNSKQKAIFEDDPPEAKLRVNMVVPNAPAVSRKIQVVPKMRVPESSVIHRVFSSAEEEEASATENLCDWEFSNGGSLTECAVWIEARRLPDRVMAIIQPLEGAAIA